MLRMKVVYCHNFPPPAIQLQNIFTLLMQIMQLYERGGRFHLQNKIPVLDEPSQSICIYDREIRLHTDCYSVEFNFSVECVCSI